MKPTEQELMAYADGELDAVSAAEIADAIAADPALAMQVEQLKSSRTIVQTAYEDIADTPLSPGLAELMDQLDPSPTELPLHDPTNISAIRPKAVRGRGASALSWPQTNWPAVAAACVAIGLIAGTMLPDRSVEEPLLFLAADGSAQPTSRLTKVLDYAPSGVEQDGVLLEASFETEHGAVCRKFSLQHQAAISCREDDEWRLVVLAETVSQDRYQAAGGADPIAVASANLGVKRLFNAEDEAVLIAANWAWP